MFPGGAAADRRSTAPAGCESPRALQKPRPLRVVLSARLGGGGGAVAVERLRSAVQIHAAVRALILGRQRRLHPVACLRDVVAAVIGLAGVFPERVDLPTGQGRLEDVLGARLNSSGYDGGRGAVLASYQNHGQGGGQGCESAVQGQVWGTGRADREQMVGLSGGLGAGLNAREVRGVRYDLHG
eukprot:scaffold222325_cov29-Prasinocladus_malaysianus.AAC.1